MDQNAGFQYRQDFNDMMKRIPNQPQTQCSLTDQMIRLWTACQRTGLMKLKKDLYVSDMEYAKNVYTANEEKLPILKHCPMDIQFQRHLAAKLAIKLGLYDVSSFVQNKINNFSENLRNRSLIYSVVWDCKEDVSDHSLEDQLIIMWLACCKTGMNGFKAVFRKGAYLNKELDFDTPHYIRAMPQLKIMNSTDENDLQFQMFMIHLMAVRLGLSKAAEYLFAEFSKINAKEHQELEEPTP